MKKLAAPGRRGSNAIKAFKGDHDELVDEIDLNAASGKVKTGGISIYIYIYIISSYSYPIPKFLIYKYQSGYIF
jgi:hypothetical protein